jgi:hypothetical protein
MSVTDVDTGEDKFSPIVTGAAGNMGSLSITETGTWSYSVNSSIVGVQSLGKDQTKTDKFTVKSLDSTATKDISITLTGVNDAPIVAQGIEDQIISINQSFSFNVSENFIDIDQGDTLAYSATSLPTGLSIAANTGIISGQTSSPGIFTVNVTAADGKGGTANDAFDLIVANNNATSKDDIIFMSQLTGINKDKLNAKEGNDRVTGTDANEFIGGAEGDDYLDGKGGSDKLLGGDGNDTLLGGLGNDDLHGGDGHDILTGWGGSINEIDQLNGGSGADTYLLGNSESVFYTTSGYNDYAKIINLEANDKIQLKGTANNYSLGSVSAVFGNKASVGVFTNSGTELIAVVNDGLNATTNLATDSRLTFV